MHLWTRFGCLLLALAGMIVTSVAAHADPVAECQTITSNQVETGRCLQDTLATAEAVMSIALEQAQRKADSLDNVTGRPGARQALDHSQLVWDQFRQADCQLRGALAAGGSGSGHFVTGCEIDLTRSRTVELNALSGDP